jgi:hypothetical protein
VVISYAATEGRGTVKWPEHLTAWWYAVIAIAGLGFGLIGERRPFGEDMLGHPLVIYFLTATAGLLVLRLVCRRPVPDLIPERALLLGCVGGIGLFLAGNFVSAHLIGR